MDVLTSPQTSQHAKAPIESYATYTTAGVVAVVLTLQGFGITIGDLTGKGAGAEVRAVEKRVEEHHARLGRMWTEMGQHRTRMASLESDIRLLNERTDVAKAEQAEFRATLRDMAISISTMAQAMARVETKVDTLTRRDP